MRLRGLAAMGMGMALAVPFARAQASFDVASVKENKASYDGRSHMYSSSSNGNFRAVNVPIKALLQVAYGLPEAQISGVPESVASAMFDVDAKMDEATDTQARTMTDDQRTERKKLMLQALFKDRFKLVAHTETRELPAFWLVPAKAGLKLDPAKTRGLTINGGYGKFSAQGMTMDGLAHELGKRAGRPVFDKTGIPGRFDMSLRWTPEEGPAKLNGAAIPDPPPDLYTAIEEQMGLRLEPHKGPVEVLVIDHLEMPDAN